MWDRLPQAHCLVICRDCLLEVQRLVRWVLRSPLKRSHLCKGSSLAVMSKCSCASTNHRPRGRHKRPRVNLRAPFFSARRRPGGLCARRSSDARAVNMAVKSTKKTKKKNTKHENTAPERTKHQNTAPTRRGSLSSVIPHSTGSGPYGKQGQRDAEVDYRYWHRILRERGFENVWHAQDTFDPNATWSRTMRHSAWRRRVPGEAPLVDECGPHKARTGLKRTELECLPLLRTD